MKGTFDYVTDSPAATSGVAYNHIIAAALSSILVTAYVTRQSITIRPRFCSAIFHLCPNLLPCLGFLTDSHIARIIRQFGNLYGPIPPDNFFTDFQPFTERSATLVAQDRVPILQCSRDNIGSGTELAYQG